MPRVWSAAEIVALNRHGPGVNGFGDWVQERSQAGFTGRYRWDTAPAAKSATLVRASQALAAGAQPGLTSGIVSPDVPRNLRITVTLGGGTQHTAKAVVVYGTDIKNQVISESFDISSLATAAIVVGVNAFKTVTAVDYPLQTQAGDAITVGTGDKLGIDTMLFQPVLLKGLRGTVAGATYTNADAGTLVASTSALAGNGYTPATVPDGTNLYRIYYISEPN